MDAIRNAKMDAMVVPAAISVFGAKISTLIPTVYRNVQRGPTLQSTAHAIDVIENARLVTAKVIMCLNLFCCKKAYGF